YSALLAPAQQLHSLRQSMFSTLLYMQNWWLIVEDLSYFDLYNAPSPLRHAWSLAIEEQFYIVWPLLFVAAIRLGGHLRGILVLFCSMGILASLFLMGLVYDSIDPSRAYYGTGTRSHTLMVGAILAIFLNERYELLNRFGRIVDVIGTFAFTGLVFFFVYFDDQSEFFYRGGSLFFSLLTALVIAATVRSQSKGLLSLFLGLTPMRKLGEISYGIYIWHWPVIVILTRSRLGIDDELLAGVQILVTLLLSTASYRLLECPIRHGQIGKKISVWHALVAGVILSIIIVISTQGRTPDDAVYEVQTQDTDRVVKEMGVDAADKNMTGNEVATSTKQRSKTVAFIGGSLAVSLHLGFVKAAEEYDIEVRNNAGAGCGFLLVSTDDNGVLFSWLEECHAAQARFLAERVFDNPDSPDLVLWLSSWDLSDHIYQGRHIVFPSEEGAEVLKHLIEEMIARFNEKGILVGLSTIPTRGVSDFLPADLDSTGQHRRYNKLIVDIVKDHPQSTVLFDLAGLICSGGPPCPEFTEGHKLRPKDGGHFVLESATWVGRRMLPKIAHWLGYKHLLGQEGLLTVQQFKHSDEQPFPVQLINIDAESVAWDVGFRTGDHIIAINGQSIISVDTAIDLLNPAHENTPLVFELERKGEKVEFRYLFNGIE
ncbi:MAG: acyltransferase family protein, partial [Pseudomonadales bacterium]|nr:acyltransferase family protein [Pseudomonadales bacterium]